MMSLPISAGGAVSMKTAQDFFDSPVTAEMVLTVNSGVSGNKKAVECFQQKMNEVNTNLKASKGINLFVINANAISVLKGKTMWIVAEYTAVSQFHHKDGSKYKKHEQWMAGKYQTSTTKSLINIKCK